MRVQINVLWYLYLNLIGFLWRS